MYTKHTVFYSFFYYKRIAFAKQFVFLHKSIIMKVLQSSFFRALCALIVGALTIMKHRSG